MNIDELLARKRLELVFDGVKIPNWDGYGAKRVSAATYKFALKIIPNCPLLAFLEFSAEPDGALTFEWYYQKNLLNISVQSKKPLIWISRIGDKRQSGVEKFEGKFPKKLEILVRKIYFLGNE